MFDKVLIPTDFSKYAYQTIECAIRIPGMKEMVILHVVDATHPSMRGWTHDREVEDSGIRLKEQENYLRSLGVKVRTRLEVIKEGNAAKAIQKVADEEGANLIIMPSRGKNLIGNIFMGSTSADVLRYGTIDLMVIHYKAIDEELQLLCPQIFSRVLYATDLSGPSMAVVSIIKGMEGLRDVDLAYVVSKGETNEEIDAQVQDAARALNALGDDLRRDGFTTRIHVPVGNPPEAIRDIANRVNASLIVIGSVGKGWIKGPLGSTAFDVARMADRPVLVVRVGTPVN